MLLYIIIFNENISVHNFYGQFNRWNIIISYFVFDLLSIMC